VIALKDKICGYYLDFQQEQIVLDDSEQLLVIAGAGSGKTLTILGKINYLIKYKNVLPEEILCISFTRASSNSLKEKISSEFGVDIPVFTFHKLSLNILKKTNLHYDICDSFLLEVVVREFFCTRVVNNLKFANMVLRYFDIYTFFDVKNKYLKFYSENYLMIKSLEKLVMTFLNLFKCNGYKLEDFSLFLKKARKNILSYRKEKIFLTIALNIYLIYEGYLKENGEIDFDDMISKASSVIENKQVMLNYKYVIIDEYQDTSYIRFLLIKKIIDNTNSKLMVVGDDFQSIYRFTGCDISLFLNFNNYFSDAKIMKIENTYRNSSELIKVAGDFVMKNKKQIRKCLKSNKKLDYPIKIVYYTDRVESFLNLVIEMFQENNAPIMVLGRNNDDINKVIGSNFKLMQDGKLVCNFNKEINLYYLTVHKSKGLEEENVIIINMEDSLLGFPSKIKNDKIMRFVTVSDEEYLFGEERRLFYVALTRTKRFVYIMVPSSKPSIFIKELLTKEYLKDKYVEIYN